MLEALQIAENSMDLATRNCLRRLLAYRLIADAINRNRAPVR
jgi:hypothetical protein